MNFLLKFRRDILRKIAIGLAIVGFAVVTAIISIPINPIVLISNWIEPPSWMDHTSPLTEEQQKNLCTKLGLSKDDSKCIETAFVYGPDFFPTIKERLNPENSEGITYQEVEEVLGDYFDYCVPFPPEKIGIEKIACYYDLRGDGMFPISTYFDENGILEDIFNSTEVYD